MSEGYLLDTDVWTWFLDGDEGRFAKAALKTLTTAASKDQLIVSDASLWEVANRNANGSLELWPTLDDWLNKARTAPGITYLSLDRETLILSTRLPGRFKGTTSQKMLLAAAALHGLRLATANSAMLAYGERMRGNGMLDVTK